jgi:signal transduction histidine kinase
MCRHAVQFYETDRFLCDEVARFVCEGLRAGESVIVVTTRLHREAIESKLKQQARFEDSQPAGGARLIWRDADETLSALLVNGWPDAARCENVLGALVDEASDSGKVPARVFGEMVAVLCAAGNPEAALHLEQLWNELARHHAFSRLCAYPMRVFAGEDGRQAFHAICAAHFEVMPSEAFEATPADPIRFHLAVATLHQKARALQSEVADRKAAERALSELAAHQNRIREEERKRIAREIHDELGSVLTGIKAYVSVAVDRARREGRVPDRQLIDASELADVALETVRRVITDLRPSVLDELGIWVALEWYLDQMQRQSGLHCSLAIDPCIAEMQVGPECSTALFRIVQEALTNAVRHAEASAMHVRVRRQGGFAVFEISDNGKGLDAAQLFAQQSWGIAGMNERARHFGGDLTVTGTPGAGTTVALRLLLETLLAS